ncbi:MAG: NrfD/PsrC family molybdoenzyme membrane anchor subunit [Anaerolineales bacterium]|nr:NrfD/PsrC family molybdoenzyme membrane anchor subunit [Anaerolineales bacterium]
MTEKNPIPENEQEHSTPQPAPKAESAPTVQRKPLQLTPLSILWGAGIVALLIGVIGLFQRFQEGLRPTALGSYVPWGLWVATYEYFVWLEIGSLVVFTLIVYVFKLHPILHKMAVTLYLTALVILAMALILIGLDLGHPFRFWHVLVWPQWSSLLAWMIWAHMIYMVVLLAKLLIEAYGKSETLKAIGRALSYISIPLGLALVAIAGSVFSVMVGRPAWQGNGLPLYFLISSLVAGTGLLTFLFTWFYPNKQDPEYLSTVRWLGNLLLGLLVVGLVAASLGGMVLLYPGIPAQAEALRLALFGPFWWVYWIVHIGLGVVVPMALLLGRNPSSRQVGVAATLLITTFIAVPLNIVIPAQVVIGIIEAELVAAFHGPTLMAGYFPTLNEWLVTLFALAFGFLVFLFGFTVLRLRPHADISAEEASK